jgi:hypothetical protein
MPVTNLDYAGDILTFSTSKCGLQRVANAVQDFCIERGMLINVAKTELITFVRGSGGGKPRASLMGQAVRVGKVVKYFGPPHGITAHKVPHAGSLHGAW